MLPIHLALLFTVLLASAPSAPIAGDHHVDLSCDGETSDVFVLIDYPFPAGVEPK